MIINAALKRYKVYTTKTLDQYSHLHKSYTGSSIVPHESYTGSPGRKQPIMSDFRYGQPTKTPLLF